MINEGSTFDVVECVVICTECYTIRQSNDTYHETPTLSTQMLSSFSFDFFICISLIKWPIWNKLVESAFIFYHTTSPYFDIGKLILHWFILTWSPHHTLRCLILNFLRCMLPIFRVEGKNVIQQHIFEIYFLNYKCKIWRSTRTVGTVFSFECVLLRTLIRALIRINKLMMQNVISVLVIRETETYITYKRLSEFNLYKLKP